MLSFPGINPNRATAMGRFPLVYAIEKGLRTLIDALLLCKGIDVDYGHQSLQHTNNQRGLLAAIAKKKFSFN